MTQNTANSTPPNLMILILLVSYASVSALLFTPSLPILAKNLSISDSAIQFTVAIFLLGYALGQLIYGPLASAYGRKHALAIGLCIALVGEIISLIAVITTNLNVLLLGRLVTAVGASSGYALTFAIIRDSYELERSRQILATAILAFAIAPGIAVTTGAFLVSYFGETSNFYALLIYGTLILLLSRRLPETAKTYHLSHLNLRSAIKRYRHVLSNQTFVLYALSTGLWGSFLYMYYAHAPFIATKDFHLSIQHYGTLTIITSLGYFIGNVTARVLTHKNSAQKVIHIGLRIILVGIVFMTAEYFGLFTWSIMYFISVAICFVGGAMLMSNFVALGMNAITDVASGSAMFGCISLLGPALTVLLSNYFGAMHLNVFLLTYIGLFSLILILNNKANCSEKRAYNTCN